MNNYEILGLKKGASISEVKSKFRQLSKKWHPDMPGGNAAKFISIRKAYEALLEGDSGEKTQQNYWESEQAFRQDQARQQQGAKQQQWEQARYQQSQRRQPATFRFINIQKDSVGYVVKFHVDRVDRINIFGKRGNRVGTYNVRGKAGQVNLQVDWEQAKEANYHFEITLVDKDGYSATVTYKVKPPMNGWEKIINKLKFWK